MDERESDFPETFAKQRNAIGGHFLEGDEVRFSFPKEFHQMGDPSGPGVRIPGNQSHESLSEKLTRRIEKARFKYPGLCLKTGISRMVA
jgi:hypothetical protein|tara:strand:+ start:178 stop:444 length:267 start_codon:yes stop_codon:yes gene_type:complete